MMSRRTVFGVLAGGAAALLSGCGLFGGGSGRLRYRITVEIETPSGLKTGSSVLENESPSRSGLAYGEAPMVDLGSGRYVFALLHSPNGDNIYGKVMRVLKDPNLQPPMDVEKHLFVQANDLKPFGVIKPEDYPMLVTFGDINDPKTVREFSPSGVKRITFQVVDEDEPLTEGIEGRLVWLDKYENISFNHPEFVLGTVDEVPFAQLFNSTNFRWNTK